MKTSFPELRLKLIASSLVLSQVLFACGKQEASTTSSDHFASNANSGADELKRLSAEYARTGNLPLKASKLPAGNFSKIRDLNRNPVAIDYSSHKFPDLKHQKYPIVNGELLPIEGGANIPKCPNGVNPKFGKVNNDAIAKVKNGQMSDLNYFLSEHCGVDPRLANPNGYALVLLAVTYVAVAVYIAASGDMLPPEPSVDGPKPGSGPGVIDPIE